MFKKICLNHKWNPYKYIKSEPWNNDNESELNIP